VVQPVAGVAHTPELAAELIAFCRDHLAHLKCPRSIDFSHEAEQYVLRVQDHGPGIDSVQLPHIFNSYYRGQRDGAISGSGLGLHLVKRIAELHDARVQVQSQVGNGSTFSVYFPRTST
jgi:signal transduction histidine kinase